jgi:GDP-D-mannose dehydratase
MANTALITRVTGQNGANLPAKGHEVHGGGRRASSPDTDRRMLGAN